MKKIILSLAILSFSTSMVNANTITNNEDSFALYLNEPGMDCYDRAADFEAFMGGGYEHFAAMYDSCCMC